MSRYSDKRIVLNKSSVYHNIFDMRNVKFIYHHRQENNLNLPDSFLNNIIVQQEVWKQETKLYKLSTKYYGTPDYWWVIGIVNNKPTDVEWKIGETVKIPINITSIIEYLTDNRINREA